MKKILFAITGLLFIFLIPQSASAISTTRGQDYQDMDLGNGTHVWSSQPEWAYQYTDGNGVKVYSPYLLSQTSGAAQVLTQGGSFVFDKNNCAITFYKGNDTSTPVIKSDSYVVKANQDGTPTWNNVNVINNAACQTTINQNGNDIEIVGTKSVAGAGTFKVHYIKNDGQKLKTTIEATNLNPAWTNFHIGLTETLQVPQIITLGNQTYDLSQFNGTVLNRNWIINHQAQLVNLGNNVNFDFTLAFNYVKQITIYWQNNQASLAIDYTNNTPILQPGNTVSVDPTFGFSAATTQGRGYGTLGSNSASCPAFVAGDALSRIQKDSNPNSGGGVPGCMTAYYKFTISSIPSTMTIYSATLKYEVLAAGLTNPLSSTWRDITGDALPSSNQYTHSQTGTALTGDDSGTTTSGTGKTVSYSAGGITALQADLNGGGGIHQVGGAYTNLVRDGSVHQTIVGGGTDGGATAQLQVVYFRPQTTTVHAIKSDSSAVFPANVIRVNASGTNNYGLNSTGFTTLKSGQVVFQNFTLKTTDKSIVEFKQYNYNATSNSTLTFNARDFFVDCPSSGAGSDLELWTNETDGHQITSFPAPTCFANDTVKWHPYFFPNGKSSASFSSTVLVKIINGTFMMNPTLKANSTMVTTSLAVPYITSNSFTVGSGLSKIGLYMSMNLTHATTATAPQSLTATAVSTSQINLAWTKPASNGTYPLLSYQIWRNNTKLVNDTGSTTPSYSNTLLTSGDTQTYKICAWTLAGCGAFSSTASATTWEGIGNVSVLVNKTIVGDAIEVTPRIVYGKGNPAPTIIQEKLFNKTITRVTNSTMNHATSGRGIAVYGPGLYDAYLTTSNSNYTMSVRLTNSVGTVNASSNNSTGNVQRSYNPSYFIATDPTQGFVNFTVTRSTDQKTITLNVNRQVSGAIFPLDCKFQTSFEAQFNTGGFWINRSDVGFGKLASTVSPTQIYYMTCYDGLLFTGTSYFNGSAALFGIAAFNNTFGAFLGVPVGVFFIVMAAALGNRRTAPMWVVIILAIAGMMATIGFFTLDQNVWYMAIIAGLLGLFVGRKLF